MWARLQAVKKQVVCVADSKACETTGESKRGLHVCAHVCMSLCMPACACMQVCVCAQTCGLVLRVQALEPACRV